MSSRVTLWWIWVQKYQGQWSAAGTHLPMHLLIIKPSLLMLSGCVRRSFPFPARAMYNLDEDESQGGIAINLMPLLAKDMQSRGEQHCRDKKENKSVTWMNVIYLDSGFNWPHVFLTVLLSAGILSVCPHFSGCCGFVRRNRTKRTWRRLMPYWVRKWLQFILKPTYSLWDSC